MSVLSLGEKTRHRLLFTLTIVSGSIIALSELQSFQTLINPTSLVLTLTPLMWFGFALLSIAFVTTAMSSKTQTSLMAVQVGLLFAGLYLFPVLTSGSPAAYHSYDFLSQSIEITRTGHVQPQYFPFEYWTGSWTTYASFIILTNIVDRTTLVNLFTVLWQALFALMGFVIFRRLSESMRIALLGAWVFLLGDWLLQAYVSDQSLGYFLLLALVVLVVDLQKDESDRGTRIGVLVLCEALVISHVLSSLVALVWMIMVAYWRPAFRRAAIVLTMSYAAWVAIYAFLRTKFILTTQLYSLYGNLVQFITGGLINKFSPSETSVGHHMAIQLEFLDVCMFLGVGITSYILYWKRDKDSGRLGLRLMLALIFASVLVLFAVNGLGGLELFQRTFFFSLIPISFFMGLLLKTSSRWLYAFLVLFFVVAAPINLIAQYNTLPVNSLSRSELYAIEFFDAKTNGGIVYGSIGLGLGNGGLFNSVQPGSYSVYQIPWGNSTLPSNSYLAVMKIDTDAYLYADGGNTSQVDSLRVQLDQTSQIVYSNPDATVYITP
ncbi:MAG: hypothetical protein QW292_03930 [Candidatus Parvarchaeota archaeon]